MTAAVELRTVALLENHTAVLNERSMMLRERRVERFADGTLRHNRTTTPYAGDERYQVEIPVERYERWGNGSVGVEVITAGEDRRYGVDRPDTGPVSRFDRLYLLLSTLEPTVVRDSGDGIAVRAAGVTGIDLDDPVRNARNVTLVVRISGEGVVREYRLSYTGVVDGATVRVPSGPRSPISGLRRRRARRGSRRPSSHSGSRRTARGARGTAARRRGCRPASRPR